MPPILSTVALWAQEAPASSDVLKYLGPFAAAAIIAGFWIRDLLAQRKESQARERLRDDKMLELAERTLPVLAEASKVNADAARLYSEVLDELRRIQARRGS